MYTVQQIGKILNKAGLHKASTARVNFETVNIGEYDIQHVKIYGQNSILVRPANGYPIENIIDVLEDANISYEVLSNGYIKIK